MASLGASERVDVPWVTLMGSPSITARLPGVVAQRVHAAAGTCITDEHKARGRQRAGATQRGATTSVCASLCQSFVAEVSRGGVLKTQTIFGPQLFKAVNKVFKSTSWFPWYKSFSLTCKAQRKFHPSIPNFYLKRHLGYSLLSFMFVCFIAHPCWFSFLLLPSPSPAPSTQTPPLSTPPLL